MLLVKVGALGWHWGPRFWHLPAGGWDWIAGRGQSWVKVCHRFSVKPAGSQLNCAKLIRQKLVATLTNTSLTTNKEDQ